MQRRVCRLDFIAQYLWWETRPVNEPKNSSAKSKDAGSARFAELDRRFRVPLLAYFGRRVRDIEDAEELTQETFLRLLRRIDLDDVDNIEGFVFITAANLLKDFYRTRSRRSASSHAPIDSLPIASADRNPGEIIEDRDELGVLLTAIEDLPPKCRAVFILHRFDEVPQAEIARRLNITVSMVEKHIAAALIQLKKKLKALSETAGPRDEKDHAHD
jgi:RNA polymerase sigma factor (sigma-70 family)